MRSRPPLRNGASSYFGQLNAGKRSVVLDLKEKRAVAAVRRLAGEVDILVENYRPGVMRRLGLDFAALGQVQPAPRLLLDLGLRPDGALLRPAGLRARDPRHLGLRPGASGLPEGPLDARLLRHLRRRRHHGHLCLRRHRHGAAPAAVDRAGPAHRRVDAGEHAVADADRAADGAVRGAAAAQPADLRAGGHRRRLSQHGRGERAHLPGHGRGRRPARLDHGSALCRLSRSPRQLGRAHGRVRGLVEAASPAPSA